MVFGHTACGRLHLALMPADGQQYRTARQLMERWAAEAREAGGLLSGENGIGKQKRHLLEWASPEQLAAAKAVKAFFDPEGRWGPGNFFDGPIQ